MELDLSWNGNTATIDLDVIEGTTGYQGVCSAFGKSSLSLNELEGLRVIITLYQNGNKVAKEEFVLFGIVSYEGEIEDLVNDGRDSDSSEIDKNEETTLDKEESSLGSDEKDCQTEGDKYKENQKDEKRVQTFSDKTDSNDESEQTSITSKAEANDTLPATVINMFHVLLIGSMLIVAGAVILLIKTQRILEKSRSNYETNKKV